jgi:hypothetical protein
VLWENHELSRFSPGFEAIWDSSFTVGMTYSDGEAEQNGTSFFLLAFVTPGGYDYAHSDEEFSHPGEVFVKAFVIAAAPHTLCNLVVINGTCDFSDQDGQIPIVKPSCHFFGVTCEKVLAHLRQRMRFGICLQQFGEMNELDIKPQFGDHE